VGRHACLRISKGLRKIGGLVLRTPTYRAKGTNGSADRAQQRAEETDLVAIGAQTEGDMEHVPTRCVVLVAPGRQLLINEQPVTNEGGLIRFGLGDRNDRHVRAK
jgi:hypothetical protein